MVVKSYVTFLVLGLISFRLSAQNAAEDNIQWISSSWFEAANGGTVEQASVVLSSPTNISWKYSDNSVKYDLTVRKISGTWANIANNGSLVVEADCDGNSAIVEFKKAGQRISIRIVIVKPDETFIYVLDVTDTI